MEVNYMSKLLNVFNNIEVHRKKLINILRKNNIPADDNMSLNDIDYSLGIGKLDFTNPDDVPWERPAEWLNSKEILENAPAIPYKNYFLKPIAVFLYKAVDPYIDLMLNPKYIIHTIITSDGAQYEATSSTTTTTIRHTWDTSKDIDTTANYKLRYLIIYGPHDLYNKGGIFPDYASVKTLYTSDSIPMGKNLIDIYLSNLTSLYMTGFPNLSIPVDNIYLNVNKSLLNIDMDTTLAANTTSDLRCPTDIPNLKRVYSKEDIYMPNFKPLTLSLDVLDLSSITFTISYLYKIKHIFFNTAESVVYSTSSSNDGLYFNASNVHLPKCTLISSIFRCRTIDAPLLETFSSTISVFDQRVLNLPSLKTMGTLALYNTYELYVPSLMEITGTLSFPTGKEYCQNGSGKLEIIDAPSLISISNASTFNLSSLTELHIGNGFKSNLSLSLTYLSKENYLEIMNCLADVTGEETTYTLTLGTDRLAMFTDDEKAIATNKGWVLA